MSDGERAADRSHWVKTQKCPLGFVTVAKPLLTMQFKSLPGLTIEYNVRLLTRYFYLCSWRGEIPNGSICFTLEYYSFLSSVSLNDKGKQSLKGRGDSVGSTVIVIILNATVLSKEKLLVSPSL
jgi:hypothetical protein